LTYTIISCLENTQHNGNKIFHEVESEFVLANDKIKIFAFGSGIQDMALWDEPNKELECQSVRSL
jgi:hypothetical protein